MKPTDLSVAELKAHVSYDPDSGAFTWLTRNNRHKVGDPAGEFARP